MNSTTYETLRDDLRQAAGVKGVDFGKTRGDAEAMSVMWRLLTDVSRSRSYPEDHVGFARDRWLRVLPYDGRDYHWYLGASDKSMKPVAEALLSIYREIEKDPPAAGPSPAPAPTPKPEPEPEKKKKAPAKKAARKAEPRKAKPQQEQEGQTTFGF